MIIFIIALIAAFIPSINILITFGGAIFGTIVNIYIPVLFYNRAYTFTEKNQKLERPHQEEEQETLIKKVPNETVGDSKDPRLCIKVFSWIALGFGTVIAIWGLVYVIMHFNDSKDEA